MAKHSSSKSSSEISKVKAVNLAYYKALSARDLSAMGPPWICAADNILDSAAGQSGNSHVGWAAIRRIWEAYWPTFDLFSVSMRVTKVNISGPVAWVHGVETSHRRERGKEQ